MAIFLTADSKIIVQGITGSEGSKHGARMIAAGSNVVGGTNPRKAGQRAPHVGEREEHEIGEKGDDGKRVAWSQAGEAAPLKPNHKAQHDRR